MKDNKKNPLDAQLYELPQRGESSKERIYKEVTEMKSYGKKWKPAAAALALVLIASQTSMAKDMLNRVQKVVFPSGTTIIQDEPNPFLYSKPYHQTSMATHEKQTRQEKNVKILSSEEELKKDLAFKPLLPKSDQYKATTLGFFTDSETPSQKKSTVFFAYYDTPYGKLYLQERLANRENSYDTGSDEELVEKEINGTKVAMQGKSLDAQKDNVLISMSLEKGNGQYDKLEQLFIDFTKEQ